MTFRCHRAAVIVFAGALAVSGMNAEAQPTRRYVVQFKADVRFDDHIADYAEDARITGSSRHRYHARGVLGAIMALERRHGFRADAFFSRALKGFAGPLTPGQLRRLSADPLVATIEPDDPVTLAPAVASSQSVDWGITKIGADISSTHSGDGAGEITNVHIYVIDTGVDATHPDLNVVEHVSMIGSPNTDCNGHGTGVAGIIAARDNGDFTVGVVPGAPVHGVKVLTCEGVTLPSYIIQGVDWVTAHAVKPAVVSVRNSNHFGASAFYALQAVERGMIGFAATNAGPTMAPTGGREGRLGNNAFAVAVPAARFPPLVLDMATGAVQAIANTRFDEFDARFSPDGRWIAYVSEETGRPEVYVRSFPTAANKFAVSAGGGAEPRWRRDGRELFFMAPDRSVMSVPLRVAATFESGVPQRLFQARVATYADPYRMSLEAHNLQSGR